MMSRAMNPTVLSESLVDVIHEQSWIVAQYVINHVDKPYPSQHPVKRFVELKARLAKTMTEAVEEFQQPKNDK